MHRRFGLTISALILAAIGCQDEITAPMESASTTPQTSVLSPGTWITKADYPADIYAPTSASITNSATLSTTLYVIGGRTKSSPPGFGSMTAAVRAYNVSANTWQTRTSFPRPVEHTHGAVAIDGKIYVSGGFSRRWDAAAGVYRLDELKSLYVYNPALNQWVRKRDMPFHAANGVSAAYQGKLYVAVECDFEVNFCDGTGGQGIVFRYNPGTDTWTLLTRTPHSPKFAAGGFIGTKFYLSGLVDAYGMDIYDIASGKWTTGATRPFRLCTGPYATFKAKLYQIGCHEDFDGSGVYPMLVYDPAVNTWTQRAAPPPRGNFATTPEGDIGTLSRVTLTNGQVRLELVGTSRPGNNLQYAP